jgi:uncharacterized protein (DUF1501 family)
MIHQTNRRELLLGSGALFAWAYLPRLAQAEGRDPRFLVIVLRGALDGLATVAPVGDPDWQRLRGENALTIDGAAAALPIDSFFALNPAMPNLHRLYKASQATIIHAVATPYRERSHFDGQDVLESGFTHPGSADTGWLNRALAGLPAAGERLHKTVCTAVNQAKYGYPFSRECISICFCSRPRGNVMVEPPTIPSSLICLKGAANVMSASFRIRQQF